jgi:hypothetical protein
VGAPAGLRQAKLIAMIPILNLRGSRAWRCDEMLRPKLRFLARLATHGVLQLQADPSTGEQSGERQDQQGEDGSASHAGESRVEMSV